jgi:hypothetical protein
MKQKELVKISMINSGILERLDKIEKNMIDEQDTSIKKKTQVNNEQSSLQIIREEHKTDEKGLSWFDMLLGALLGGGMLALLKGFKNLGPIKFAIRMMELGWDWLKEKVVAVATGIAVSSQVIISIFFTIKNSSCKLHRYRHDIDCDRDGI